MAHFRNLTAARRFVEATDCKATTLLVRDAHGTCLCTATAYVLCIDEWRCDILAENRGSFSVLTISYSVGQLARSPTKNVFSRKPFLLSHTRFQRRLRLPGETEKTLIYCVPCQIRPQASGSPFSCVCKRIGQLELNTMLLSNCSKGWLKFFLAIWIERWDVQSVSLACFNVSG